MYEKQPILKALIDQGWYIPGKTLGIVIAEKMKTGTALINSENGPFNIYYNQETCLWTDKKPTALIKPDIIEKHYASAV